MKLEEINALKVQPPRRRYSFCMLVAVAPGLFVLAGCGRTTERHGLNGTVTLDGQPLSQGQIKFEPRPGTTSPTAGAAIMAGKFALPAEKGLLPGEFRVEITATRATGKTRRDPVLGEIANAVEQFLPDRYNRQSELTVKVPSDSTSPIEIALTSR